MNRAIKLNNTLVKVAVVVAIFSVGTSYLRIWDARNDFYKVKQEPNSASPEQVLNHRDGFESTAENLQYYTTALDQLEAKCIESRVQLAVLGSSIAKKNQEWGFDSNSYEGLQTLISELANNTREVSCYDVTLELMRG